MAKEQNIDRDAGWFHGESKTLAYTVFKADERTVEDVSGWNCEWRLNQRRVDAPILVLPAMVRDGFAGLVTVDVSASDYTFPAGTYQASLWRMDPGFETVLAYGSVVIRSVREHQ